MCHTVEAVYQGQPVIVAMGFDVPVQGYFMTIEPVDEDSGLYYSNLDDQDIPFPGMTKDIEHYKKRLREMQIEVPPEFFGKVLAD